jgi:hypothetical protein
MIQLKFFILLLNDPKYFVTVGSFQKPVFEWVVFKNSRNSGQQFEVKTGVVFRCDQEKKDVRRLAIQGFKVNPPSTQAKSENQ